MKNLRSTMGTSTVHAYLIHSLAAHGLLLSLIVVIPLYGDGGSGRPSAGHTVMLAGGMDGLGILSTQAFGGPDASGDAGWRGSAPGSHGKTGVDTQEDEAAVPEDGTDVAADAAETAGKEDVQGPVPAPSAGSPAAAPEHEQPDTGEADAAPPNGLLSSTEQLPAAVTQPDIPSRREIPEAPRETPAGKTAPVPPRESGTKTIATPPQKAVQKAPAALDRPPIKTASPPKAPTSGSAQSVAGVIPVEPPPVAEDAGPKAGDPKPEEAAIKSPGMEKSASVPPADPSIPAQPVREEPRRDAAAPTAQKESPENPAPSQKAASTVQRPETPSLPGGADSRPPSPLAGATPGGKILAAGGAGSAPYGTVGKTARDGGLKKETGNDRAGGEGRKGKRAARLATGGGSLKGEGDSRGMPGADGTPGLRGSSGYGPQGTLPMASSLGSGPGTFGGQENVSGTPGTGAPQGETAATADAPGKIAGDDSALTRNVAKEMSVAKVFLNRDIRIEVSLQGDSPSALGLSLSRGPHPSQRPKRGKPGAEEVRMSEEPADAGGKRVFSVASAPHGTYTLVVDCGGKEPREGEIVFQLYRSSEKGRTKKYAPVRMVSGRPVRIRFVLPEALFWDDDDRFSGTIEDSRTMTKFTHDSSLIWREDKD